VAPSLAMESPAQPPSVTLAQWSVAPSLAMESPAQPPSVTLARAARLSAALPSARALAREVQ
jgi:hypothetical protein